MERTQRNSAGKGIGKTIAPWRNSEVADACNRFQCGQGYEVISYEKRFLRFANTKSREMSVSWHAISTCDFQKLFYNSS